MKIFKSLEAVAVWGGFTRRSSAGGVLPQGGTVRVIAEAVPVDAGGGWIVESQGLMPGSLRMLAYWAAAPVAAVGTVSAGSAAGVGMVPTLYAAAGIGTALIVRGGYITLRAEADADARARAGNPAGRGDLDAVPDTETVLAAACPPPAGLAGGEGRRWAR